MSEPTGTPVTNLLPTALPQVSLFALGGTIASVPQTSPDEGSAAVGVRPAVSGRELVDAVPLIAQVARVETTQVLQVPSVEITPGDLLALVELMRDAVDSGADGIVVTQGTDTLEESAFMVDLLWDRPQPVIFTAAMRTPSSPGADGPANLLAAVQLAVTPEARDLGVLVCLGDAVHAARHVRKAHSSNPAAFESPGLGPIGWVTEGRPRIALRPVRGGAPLRVIAGTDLPNVALVRIGLGDDGQLLQAVGSLDVQGLVVEGVGGGHVPRALAPVLSRLVEQMPVLLASRTGAGEVLTQTYGYPGGEIDLRARGLLGTGAYDGTKARLLLVLALAAGLDRPALDRLLTL
ncbi:asparaginase [Nocardioides gilvus]|uniref:asparaginase n=1 Tax=Nocardioides gilvus TaxID=1735589 RepID=UPI000D747170|nr:asparaginase [Nocardioides gilvus]